MRVGRAGGVLQMEGDACMKILRGNGTTSFFLRNERRAMWLRLLGPQRKAGTEDAQAGKAGGNRALQIMGNI